MSELREKVAIEIHAESWNAGEEWHDVHPVKQDNYKQQADAAIAAFTEALLSEPAVEAAAKAIHGVDNGVFPDYVRHIPSRKVYLDRARAALQAALAALQHDDAPVE